MKEVKSSLKSFKQEGLTAPESNTEIRHEVNSLAESKKKYKDCPVCGCKLLISRFKKHMELQHNIKASPTKVTNSIVELETNEIVKCPTCSIIVKKKNLKKHVRKVHKASLPEKTILGNTHPSSRHITNSSQTGKSGHTSPEYTQALLAKINQGRYDNEPQLLSLLKNANDRNEDKIVNAVHQRLKLVAPETYRKLVGPLHIRDPQGIKKCYCGNPRSLNQIADEIMSGKIPVFSLLCDACWEEDICSAWGHYGAWGEKIIDTEVWRSICEERGDSKYATY